MRLRISEWKNSLACLCGLCANLRSLTSRRRVPVRDDVMNEKASGLEESPAVSLWKEKLPRECILLSCLHQKCPATQDWDPVQPIWISNFQNCQAVSLSCLKWELCSSLFQQQQGASSCLNSLFLFQHCMQPPASENYRGLDCIAQVLVDTTLSQLPSCGHSFMTPHLHDPKYRVS